MDRQRHVGILARHIRITYRELVAVKLILQDSDSVLVLIKPGPEDFQADEASYIYRTEEENHAKQ